MNFARVNRGALLLLSVCLLAITSCRTASEPATSETPATDTVVSTTPPFKTREPGSYSATRTITTFGPQGEKKTVESMFIGRDGLIRRDESGADASRIVYLDSPEGRFVMWPEAKVYAAIEGDRASTLPPETEDDSPDRLLHEQPTVSTYRALGTETVAGRSAAKYRVVVNNSATESVNANETLIWIDDVLNMPIKSETRSPDGIVVVTELSDIKLPPDKQLFQIPTGYEKIPYSALQKQLRARGLNP